MAEKAFLEFKQVTKFFGKHKVIDDLSFTIPQGKMVTLLGPSGCGKTTVLRLIAGLERLNSGQILIGGKDVSQHSIQQRNIGIVFQSYALFPHLTIGENVGYGLKMQGIGKSERQRQICETLTLVDLAGFEDRYIDQISGGQQQRVALARALILKPKVLLFDEPLSNLDTNLRRAMREKIRALQQQLHITAVYVTHDQSEAFAVSDEVIVMNKGRIIQQGRAKRLYRQPNSRFIAHFMGEATVFEGKCQHNIIEIGDFQMPLENAENFGIANGECLIGVRPEAVRLNVTGRPCEQCQIKNAVYMGNHWEITAFWQGKEMLLKLSPEAFDEKLSSPYLQFNPTGVFLLERNERKREV